jgi:DNA-binding SARP family transcriptional activator
MIGPLAVLRGDTPVKFPASRKVRALFAYLALAPRPVPRQQLCTLFWDLPNDPKGELRWCLSKIRSLIDTPKRKRVVTQDGAISLDLKDCEVDAAKVAHAADAGVASLEPGQQRELLAHFGGEFLEGLEVARSPAFNAWLTAQRRRYHATHVALVEHLAKRSSGDEALALLESWRELAPFDSQVHEALFNALTRAGRMREAEAHLTATCELFEDDGLDTAPLRSAWQRARKAALDERATNAPTSAILVLPGSEPANVLANPQPVAPAPRGRASIAVMPFFDHSPDGEKRAARALAHDVITRLAKLRSLFVIAQGTMFALHERQVGPEEAGRILNVEYVVSGTVRRDARRLDVSVELVETRSARIVWSDAFHQSIGDTFEVLDTIGNRIVASIASEIELIERNRAVLKAPASLDAWGAHHRGLWHMYRFTKADNARAQQFFELAVKLDPTFARAHAGLSFTYFQSAFQGWTRREAAMDLAFETAGHSLMADDRDPAAHWAMGRALWLRKEQDGSVRELERAIELSPNFALGHYALAFVNSQSGDATQAVNSADYSRQLSPFDPLIVGMFGARAMALVRLGQFEAAAEWGLKAAARPNAHQHIMAIAAFSVALAGRIGEAKKLAANVRKRAPRYSFANFREAFHLDDDGARLFAKGAKSVGMT